MSEVNHAAPEGDTPADDTAARAANASETQAAAPVESFADGLMKDLAGLATRKEPSISLDVFTRPLQPITPEPEAPQPEPEAAPPAVELAAEAIADVTAPAEAASEAVPETAEEDDVLAEIARKRKASKAKKAPAAPKKRSTRAKPNVEDLGDGSGYIAPSDAHEETAAETDEAGQWYAVHCYSGQENKVKTNLEQRIETMGMAGRILKVVVPTEEEMEVKDGKRRTVERRVFPGYILVNMKMSEEAWFVVRNTPGVTRFVGMGNRPAPLTPQEVDQILRRMEAEAPKLKVNYRPGQKVRITDGPFADFMGVVDKIDTERAKVSVLVSFFGRETPVELDFLQVERM